MSWWPLWILLVCCGPAAVQKAPVEPVGGLPVEVQGNQEISLSRLRAAISAGDMSSQEAIARTVTGLYFDAGFVQAKIKMSQDSQRILVSIEEGESFVFGSLRIQGGDRRSLPRPPFQAGEIFSASKWRRYLGEIEDFYSQLNRVVVVTPLTEIDLPKHSVNLSVQIRDADGEPLPDSSLTTCTPTPGIGTGEALVLHGDEKVYLGPDRHYFFSRICVRDRAAIHICSRARITVPGAGAIVIGGRGLGGFLGGAADLALQSAAIGKVHLLVDNELGRVRAELHIPRAPMIVYSTTSGIAPTTGRVPLRVKGRGRPVWRPLRTFPVCH